MMDRKFLAHIRYVLICRILNLLVFNKDFNIIMYNIFYGKVQTVATTQSFATYILYSLYPLYPLSFIGQRCSRGITEKTFHKIFKNIFTE